jgi:hypothetical protein
MKKKKKRQKKKKILRRIWHNGREERRREERSTREGEGESRKEVGIVKISPSLSLTSFFNFPSHLPLSSSISSVFCSTIFSYSLNLFLYSSSCLAIENQILFLYSPSPLLLLPHSSLLLDTFFFVFFVQIRKLSSQVIEPVLLFACCAVRKLCVAHGLRKLRIVCVDFIQLLF